MKKIFLHIGAGKTGSSALQIWLNDNYKELKKQKITYPLFGEKIKDEYQITSGNGIHFINTLRKGKKELDLFFNTFTKNINNLFFSSEAFQNLTEEELNLVKDSALSYNYEITIIIYVRDLYDMLYSSYKQLIKRHLYTKSYKEFILNIKDIQQFSVLYKYEKVFKNIQLVHYDSFLKIGIEKPLCKILNVDISPLKPMRKHKVNRSLDLFETELLRNANTIYLNTFNDKNFSFCTTLSDLLIYTNPEKETEIYYNEELISNIVNKFEKDIEYVNSKYLKSEKLTLFNKKDKMIIEEVIEIPNEFLTIMRASINFFISQDKVIIKQESKKDLIGMLVGAAKQKESNNLDQAMQIIQTAKILRPNGKVINETIINYENRLNDKK